MLIGIDAKNGNGLMMRYRQIKGISQAEAARECGIPYFCWNMLERLNFRRVPLSAAEKIADFIGAHVVEIFPAVLRDKNISAKRTAFREVETLSLSSSKVVKMLPVADDNITEEMEQYELAMAIERSLNTLSARERGIIQRIYGLGPFDKSMTLDECSSVFGISKNRVRQIHDKAILKLQTPTRAGVLNAILAARCKD